ncbi:MAG: YfiR family protein [Spongiibacteraceae bacterium]
MGWISGFLPTMLYPLPHSSRANFGPILLALLFLTLSASTVSGTELSKNNNLKATFYYNALKFTQWPAEKFAEAEDLQIILLGNDDIAAILNEKLTERPINGHHVVIHKHTQRQTLTTAILNKAHAIYFASDMHQQYRKIIQLLKGATLTSSCIPGFARQGGMVEIVRKTSQQLEFHINADAIKQSNLTISPQMMKLAHIIDTNSRTRSSPPEISSTLPATDNPSINIK